MIINDNSVEQINVVLLDIDKRIKALNVDSETLKSLQDSVKLIRGSLNETKAGLTGGATYNINISGNAATATQAVNATSANKAEVADEAGHAIIANTADSATTAKSAESATTAESAVSAERASKDGNGDTIAATYQKKADMTDYQKVSEKNAVAGYVRCNQTVDGSYILVATVINGAVTYSWEARA